MDSASSNNWHHDFNPSRFLGRVDLNRLISRNEAYRESQTEGASSPCILCNSGPGRGILLNDRSFLCAGCYDDVARISYPEKYERLHRSYLTDLESRRLAWDAFRSRFEPDIGRRDIGAIAWLSLVLLFFHPAFLVVTALLFLADHHFSSIDTERRNAWRALEEEWKKENPEPPRPGLRHFHDPSAVLGSRDRQVLRVFNHWPGYPPFWQYLRAVVIARDGNRCQVTGCPSRLSLHVHHKKSVSTGGTHTPDNLVVLCDFHHALEPEKGHERIWGSIKNQFFTLVPAHLRKNPVNEGHHAVRAHLRRLSLVTLDELKAVHNTYGFCCPNCHSPQLVFRLFSDRRSIQVGCKACEQMLEGPQQLTEETGPLLAERLSVTRNKGSWVARWDMLDERTQATWGNWHRKKDKPRQKREPMPPSSTTPTCPKCGSPMRLIVPGPGQPWKTFWGCSQYPTTQCRGSRRYRP